MLDREPRDLGRDSGWVLRNGETLENLVEYGYSPTDARLSTVADASDSFSYEYVPGSNLVQTVTGPVHTVDNTWEPNRDVLGSKKNSVPTENIVPSSFFYTVDPLGRRTNVGPIVEAGNPISTYTPKYGWEYDELGGLIKEDYNDNKSSDTRDRVYQYDTIGNRLKTDSGILTLPEAENYAANQLNQYTKANGITLPTGPPPVDSLAAYDADGNYQHGPLPVDQTTNAVLEWDAENRLVKVTKASGDVIAYAYDSLSRRIAKIVDPAVGATVQTTFVYDGWNVIAEYVGTSLKMTYTWGVDLSGTMQGAGGVGGLLAVTKHATTGSSTFYPTFDGNGNVTEYLDSSGVAAAHFEYDGFGNTVVDNDTEKSFTYRFSTKPLDIETGFYYYTYRYYDPLTGRWPSRDPIEENGGVNVYGFVENDAMNRWDMLGQQAINNPGTTGAKYAFIVNGLDSLNDLEHITDMPPRKGEVCLQIGHSNPSYSGQCATCCQLLTCTRKDGATYDAPSTTTWVPGDAVENGTTPRGLMIATGWVNGNYPSTRTGNHTAIYLGPGSTPGSIRILSQNDGGAAQGKNIGVNEWSSAGWHIVTSNIKHDSSVTKCTIKTCTPTGETIEELSFEEAVRQWEQNFGG